MSANAINKYVRLYMKRNSLLALFCATICFIPFFACAILYDVLWYDIFISFVPYVLAGIIILISYFLTFRFRKEIKRQEEKFNVRFSDTGKTKLDSTIFISDEWLIFAGTHAWYKPNIKSITDKILNAASSKERTRFTIVTIGEEKTNVVVYSPLVVEKINSWKNK